MGPYWLSKHVDLCVTSDHAVLLDRRADKYLAVDRSLMRILSTRVVGWPADQSGRPDLAVAALDDGCDAISLNKLLDMGWLTADQAAGRDATPVRPDPPCGTLLETTLLHTLVVGPHPKVRRPNILDRVRAIAYAPIVLYAYLIARKTLRQLGLMGALSRLQQRSTAYASRKAPECDTNKLRNLVWIYRTVRPFVFSAREACLIDSLTLREFLATRGIHPQLIIGVRTRPFSAHCWLQVGGIVCNDTAGHAQAFTPIVAA